MAFEGMEVRKQSAAIGRFFLTDDLLAYLSPTGEPFELPDSELAFSIPGFSILKISEIDGNRLAIALGSPFPLVDLSNGIPFYKFDYASRSFKPCAIPEGMKIYRDVKFTRE